MWFTALEPDKIDVFMLLPQNGKTVTLPITRAGRTANSLLSPQSAFVWEKAFTSYYSPQIESSEIKRSPVNWQMLPEGAALLVINNSKDAEGNKFFYQASIRPPHTDAVIFAGKRERISQKAELAPGGEKTIELTGAGLIETISLAFNQAQDVQSLQLRAAWDGEAKNAVDAPLSALLGLFQHGESVNSAAFAFSGKNADWRWPMPFGNGAKITLVNIGNAPLSIDVKIGSLALQEAPKYRFFAVYGSARSEEKKPIQMLKIAGKGAFCGLNLSISPAPDSGRRTFAYLEGNETITADGKKYEGTGTEDFFSSAWYFPKKSFSFPFHGMTYKTMSPPAIAAYRLMIPDALPFQKSLQFDFEHGNNYNSNDLLFRWVAFWYQEPAGQSEIIDALRDNAPSDSSDGPSHLNIFLVALVTALIVGGGGGLVVKIARKRAEKPR